MFTPPPSPAPPPRTLREESPLPSDSDDSEGAQYLVVPQSFYPRHHPLTETKKPTAIEQHASAEAAKHQTGRRTRWTILLIPLVLVFITASTRYVSHPAVLDMFSADQESADWQSLPSSLREWRVHKRHASPDPAPQANQADASESVALPTSASSQSALSLASSSSPIPTSGAGSNDGIPVIPSSPPILPTPFPQPLDQTFSYNFSTQACMNFFTNMTLSDSFRSCRPFSLLEIESGAFVEVSRSPSILPHLADTSFVRPKQSQDNITTLNNVIWGTCNTSIDAEQCNENMSGFADTLKDICSTDLAADNAVVQTTLNGESA